MVKAVIYTVIAAVLSVGLFLFTEQYVNGQFEEFGGALDTLYAKVEDETANREDGYAVRAMWEQKKSRLQVFVPHNDIAGVDHWLSEACALIYTQQYALALGKLEVLKEMAKNLPAAYSIRIENIF